MSPDLAALYDAHASVIRAYALAMTRCAAEADDVVQEVFCRVAREGERWPRVTNHRAYLMRAAHNRICDQARRRKSHNRYVSGKMEEIHGIFEFGDDPDTNLFAASVADALAELPPEQRSVLMLKLWSGMTFAGISGALGIPANTAASRYRYAIDKLREHLRPIYEEIQ